ncbi:S9 family peptidase [Sphingorhabdus profundilacus]|nr:S9 family peptidase [Sphingorhabdus profundilacus]
MRFIITGILAAAVIVPVSAADKRLMTVDDLSRLKTVSAPAIDPDGEWVAYSVGEVDVDGDKTFSHIWMTSWDGTRTVQLTSRKGESESSPRWSLDGRYLAFISARDDEKERDQLWLLDRSGGEAKPPAQIDGSVIDYAWSPNGKQIALIVLDADPNEAGNVAGQATIHPPQTPGKPNTDTISPKQPKAADSALLANGKKEEKKLKPIVVDRYQFKRDMDGYLGKQRQRLVVLDLSSGNTRRLTTGDFDEYLPSWSPDGKQIAFVSNRDQDPDRTYNSDLFVVPAMGAPTAPIALTSFKGADNDPSFESYPVWSPDGRSIAYLQGGPIELFAYGVRKLAVIAATGGTPKILTAGLDRNVSQPVWSRDGKSLRFLVEDDGAERLSRVSVNGGSIQPILTERRDVLSIFQQGDKTAILSSNAVSPPEVFALEGQNLRPLSKANDTLLEQLKLAPVEETRFKSSDGTEIHGFLVRPPAAALGKVPTLLRIHGGPQSQFSASFSPEWQIFAANGYAVVAANPRGSTGRGQDFAKAIYAAWGSVDVQDVLAAVDDAVSRGVADPNRLGVGGWSYGGMLTNYTIASDRRFKAATSGASISNILAGYGTDQYIRDYEMELGKPWEKLETWMKVSYPFYQANRIVTPTLFLAGDKDFNVPLLNSEQMYQALQSQGIDTQLVIYPGQFHGLDRPSFIRDRMQRYLDWYSARLK